MKSLFLSFAPPEKWRDGKSRNIESEEWQLIRKKILERDNYTCAYCGYKSSKYQIIDHIDGNPKNDKDDNLQVICQMCNLIKHSGQGCEIKGIVELYKESKYTQNEIIKITREMRDKGKSDEEIIISLGLKNKVPFKMSREYLNSLFGFITSKKGLQEDEKRDMYNCWLDYHNNLKMTKPNTFKPENVINNSLNPRYDLPGNAGLPTPQKGKLRAILFIDGNNWYHNVKKIFTPSEIDIKKVANLICNNLNYKLEEIQYYVSVPSIEDGENIYYKHMSFLSYLQKIGVKLITRKLQRLSNKQILLKRKETIDSLDLCDNCKPLIEEVFTDLADLRRKEKGIDVWIAIDMIRLSIIENKCDVCILISGDADFVPALNLIKSHKKEVLSSFVYYGYSSELRAKFPYLFLSKGKLMRCLKSYKGDNNKNVTSN